MHTTTAIATEWSPAREELRGLLGAVVDELTDRQCGRCLATLFGAVKRELDSSGNPDQMTLSARS